MSYSPLNVNHQSAQDRRQKKVFTEAAESLGDSLGIDVAVVRRELDSVHWDHKFRKTLADTETAKSARDRLDDVEVAAKALIAALEALGPAAVHVMGSPGTVDLKLFLEAKTSELPDRDPIQNVPFWHHEASDEQNREWEEEWKRGGRWVISLKALAQVAKIKADRIEERTKNPGPIRLGAFIHGKPDERLAEQCHHFIQKHGGSRPLAREMMQAIKEAETGIKRKCGAGRKAIKKVSRTPTK